MIFDRKNLINLRKNCRRINRELFGFLINRELDRIDKKNPLFCRKLRKKNQGFRKNGPLNKVQFLFAYLVMFLASRTFFYFGKLVAISLIVSLAIYRVELIGDRITISLFE